VWRIIFFNLSSFTYFGRRDHLQKDISVHAETTITMSLVIIYTYRHYYYNVCIDNDRWHCNSSFRMYWDVLLKMVAPTETCKRWQIKKKKKNVYQSHWTVLIIFYADLLVLFRPWFLIHISFYRIFLWNR
jgi:hypothetical protein